MAVSSIAQLFTPIAEGISLLKAQDKIPIVRSYSQPGRQNETGAKSDVPATQQDSTMTKPPAMPEQPSPAGTKPATLPDGQNTAEASPTSLPDSAATEDMRLTIRKIKHDVNAVTIRGFCTDEMAQIILASGDAPAYVGRIGDAVGKITAAMGEHHPYWALRPLHTQEIKKLFIQSLDAFVKISQASGSGTSWAFSSLSNLDSRFLIQTLDGCVKLSQATGQYAYLAFNTLSDPCLSELLAQNPWQVVDAFVKIAHASGGNVYLTFGDIARPSVAKLIVQNPDACVKISQASGEYAHETFRAINIAVPELFAQNADACVKIAQASGGYAWDAFDALCQPRTNQLFAQDPVRFVKIAGDSGEKAGAAFRLLVK